MDLLYPLFRWLPRSSDCSFINRKPRSDVSAYLAYTSKIIQEWTLQRRNQLGGEASLIMKKNLHVIFHFWPHSSYGQLQSKVMCWGHPWVMFLSSYMPTVQMIIAWEGREKPEFLENPDIQWWQMMEGQTPACPSSPKWSSTVNAHSWILHTYLQVVINSVLMCMYVSIKFHHIHRYSIHCIELGIFSLNDAEFSWWMESMWRVR